MSISVAMAVCNGEKYLKDQIDSILPQLQEEDELVISIDPSNDKTNEILNAYTDTKIKKIQGPGEGILKNFENALMNTTGEIVFLCDQDDIWEPDKVEMVSDFFDGETTCVVHDAVVIDENENVKEESYYKFHGTKEGYLNNVVKNSFIGCCMAVSREVIESALPFPDDIPMHDQWLGLVAYKEGTVRFIPDKLIKYRRHAHNTTSMAHASFSQMLKWRLSLIKMLQERGFL